MNWYLVISGAIALFTTIGHFTVGRNRYLIPMLEASFDPIAKKVMQGVFHYISAYLILSTIVLLSIGTGAVVVPNATPLIRFIAANYALFAIWQIYLAITSNIPNGILKLFQWIFFTLISGFALVGVADN